jgi:hypothetical protein
VRFRGVIGAFSGILLAASCSLGESEDAGSVNVFVEINKTQLALGDSVTITVWAQNVGYDPVTLIGPGDCLLRIEVRSGLGQVVWNPPCSGANVTEQLASGAEKTLAVVWNGSQLTGPWAAGDYVIRGIARIEGGAFQSLPVSVRLE